MNINVCCALVFYKPSKVELLKVMDYSEHFDRVFVYDNTPGGVVKNDNFGNDKVVLLGTGNNDGMSVALNRLSEISFRSGFEFCAFFDQDSNVDSTYIKTLLANLKSERDSSNVALFCPVVTYEHCDYINPSLNKSQQQVEWAITSGSILNLRYYEKFGGFDENYFIDRLEHDFCFNARKNGYIIVRYNDIFLKQSLGEVYRKLGKKRTQHSAIRNYYKFRNRIYYYAKNRDGSVINRFSKCLLGSIFQILNVILFETNKIEKLTMITLAFMDALMRNYGKFLRD